MFLLIRYSATFGYAVFIYLLNISLTIDAAKYLASEASSLSVPKNDA